VSSILSAVLVLGGLGALLGFLLVGVARLVTAHGCRTEEDFLRTLPGADCGGCGRESCAAMARDTLAGHADIDECILESAASSVPLDELLGAQARGDVRATALVRCSGGDRAKKKFTYEGLPDCTAAMMLGSGGPMACQYGCIGLRSCVKVCPRGALSVTEGVAIVDHERCIGCMKCAAACPKHIIIQMPYYADVVVACSSVERGSALRQVCGIGCLGCRVCVRVCTHGAITVTDSLASIDYEKCVGCGDCAEKCPRKLIIDSNLDRGPRLVKGAE